MTEMIPRPDITCPDAVKARELATSDTQDIRPLNPAPTAAKAFIARQEQLTRHFYRTGWRYNPATFYAPPSYTYEVDGDTTITITENNG